MSGCTGHGSSDGNLNQNEYVSSVALGSEVEKESGITEVSYPVEEIIDLSTLSLKSVKG